MPAHTDSRRAASKGTGHMVLQQHPQLQVAMVQLAPQQAGATLALALQQGTLQRSLGTVQRNLGTVQHSLGTVLLLAVLLLVAMGSRRSRRRPLCLLLLQCLLLVLVGTVPALDTAAAQAMGRPGMAATSSRSHHSRCTNPSGLRPRHRWVWMLASVVCSSVQQRIYCADTGKILLQC